MKALTRGRAFQPTRISRAISLLLSVLLLGCQGLYMPRKETSNLPGFKRIAVLPLDRARILPGQKRPTCTLTSMVFDVSGVPEEASMELTSTLWRLLQGDPRFFLVPEGQCAGILSAFIESDIKAARSRLIKELGKRLNADAVVYGIIYRYRERTGGEYGVDRPASVAFALCLIRVSDGAVLWHYNFDETQEPLLSDLFKIRMFKQTGMKWITVKRLSEIGLERAVEDLLKRLP